MNSRFMGRPQIRIGWTFPKSTILPRNPFLTSLHSADQFDEMPDIVRYGYFPYASSTFLTDTRSRRLRGDATYCSGTWNLRDDHFGHGWVPAPCKHSTGRD